MSPISSPAIQQNFHTFHHLPLMFGIVHVICQTLTLLNVVEGHFFGVVSEWAHRSGHIGVGTSEWAHRSGHVGVGTSEWAHRRTIWSNPVQVSLYVAISGEEAKIGKRRQFLVEQMVFCSPVVSPRRPARQRQGQTVTCSLPVHVTLFYTNCKVLIVANEETVELYLCLSCTLSLCHFKYRVF